MWNSSFLEVNFSCLRPVSYKKKRSYRSLDVLISDRWRYVSYRHLPSFVPPISKCCLLGWASVFMNIIWMNKQMNYKINNWFDVLILMFSLWFLYSSSRSDYQICCHSVSHVTRRCASAAVWKCSLWAAVSGQPPSTAPRCVLHLHFSSPLSRLIDHTFAPIDICYAQHFPYSVNTPRRQRRLRRPPGKGLFVQTGRGGDIGGVNLY